MTVLTEDQHKVVRLASERMDAFPETHDQHGWYLHHEDPLTADDGWTMEHGTACLVGSTDLAVDPLAMRECGSAACCAGHIVLAALALGVEVRDGSIEGEAMRLAGIDEVAAKALFDSAAHEDRVRQWLREAAASGETPDRTPWTIEEGRA